MFLIYDSLKEKSIVCFKPDIRRGKYKQVSTAEEEPDEKLCFYVTFTHRLPLTVLENSMNDTLYREALDVVIFGSVNSRSFRGSCSGNTISMQIRSMPAPFE